jgi:periplasmic mercuric ion binding protein
MRTKTASTALLVVTVVTMLVVLAFRVRVGTTADAIAVLQTTGMTCGRCSSTITSALEQERGVAASEVDVAGGCVIVCYDSKTVKAEVLAQKVTEAGFGSKVYAVQTPAQFKQATGRDFGKTASEYKGCGGCGTKSGCGTQQQN